MTGSTRECRCEKSEFGCSYFVLWTIALYVLVRVNGCGPVPWAVSQ